MGGPGRREEELLQGVEIWLVKSDELATRDSGLVAEKAQATPTENAQSDPHCEQESCARPGLPGCAWENGPCRVLLEQGHTRNMIPSLLTPCDGQPSGRSPLHGSLLC